MQACPKHARVSCVYAATGAGNQVRQSTQRTDRADEATEKKVMPQQLQESLSPGECRTCTAGRRFWALQESKLKTGWDKVRRAVDLALVRLYDGV